MSEFPLITMLTLVPLVGAAIIAGLEPDQRSAARRLGILFNLAALAIAVLLWLKFDTGREELQFVERYPWIPSIRR